MHQHDALIFQWPLRLCARLCFIRCNAVHAIVQSELLSCVTVGIITHRGALWNAMKASHKHTDSTGEHIVC